MSESYIPLTDDGFRVWAQNFATTLSNDFGTYMLTEAQAASIQQVVDDYVDKLAIANHELSRNKQTIADKDDAKNVADALCRNYAMLIKENTGISDGDKLAAGVRPINPNRDPIFCPQTQPLINVLGAIPGSHTVLFKDPTLPNSKRKPFGASELQLFMAITDGPNPAPFSEARFYGKFTKNPIAVEFSEGDNLKLATYYARWAGRRGDTGPMSLPVAMAIAA